jgi:glycosyltransferase involved in cell wall biosynthesis
MQQEDFDIVVVHTSHEWPALLRDVPLLLTTRRARPATIMQLHGSQPERLLDSSHPLYKFLSSKLVEMCDAILLLSTEERQQWERLYPARRFYVVSNPFVAELQTGTSTAKGLWPVADGVPMLLFVGRLIEEKGIFDLLDAIARLVKRTPCHLLVAGDGLQAQQVRDRVVELRLEEHVTVAGYLRGDDLAAAYACATAFALPTYWPEGFPTVISEAMSCGLPIVTTYTRGVVDHLQEGVNALFVPPRDPVRLADTLLRLLADDGLRGRMSQANQEKVKEFAPEIVAQHYLDVLEDVVGRR